MKQISETPMSSVYLAEEVHLGRRVVLKVLSRRLAEDRGFRERFKREAVAAARLDHPNIVPVYSTGEVDGRLYLVLRYVKGADLSKLLQTEPRGLDLARTSHILTQVAAALDAAHEAGIVHRDVKPGNILIDHDTGHAYLSDFGIAKVASADPVTNTGQFLGTSNYAAPEQILGHQVDRRTDVYALGCVVHECLTGTPPFRHGETAPVLWGHLHHPPPPVTARRPELGPGIDAVVARALAKNPADRYPTCGQFAAALAALDPGGRHGTTREDLPAGSSGGLTTLPPPPRGLAGRWSRSIRRHRIPVAAAVAAVLLLTTAALGLARARNDGGSGPSLADRVPAALRHNCAPETRTVPAGASHSWRCRTGTGQSVRFDFFDTQDRLGQAYDRVVRESGVARGQGDCSVATGAEHRYPAAGAPAGRLLCFTKGSTTSLVWTDDRARTLARADGIGDLALMRAWNSWTAAPAFPTREEQALIALAGQEPADCRRVPPGGLDEFHDVVAAVDCSVAETGAARAAYYRFAGPEGLQRSFHGQVGKARAPWNDDCPDADVPGFLGVSNWTYRQRHAGHVFCRPGARGQFVVEWTAEPLLFMGRATGASAAELSEWWQFEAPPAFSELVKGLNAHAVPAYPTPAEKALLDRIPPAARVDCLRPGREQLQNDLDGAQATAIACDPVDSAAYIVYYRFPDAQAMRRNYERIADGAPKRDCTESPDTFSGEAPYSIAGSPVGRLWCGTDDDDDRFLTWTHDRLNIQVMAFDVDEPEELLGWLPNAGPR
ncbi:serine/threonine-protein kinase [Thermomonospora cellulosilytica]|uniref:non-specific serine/threonine protein kinase n=1 Tax=Thermomonospora cellulosilytica TaxID=1411118 RepID=A0A7W3MW48_9ACTN|nr:serine/threonine-protein kinase [Thermomonospora cellulosilytica]MBA9002963.1 hypothetical protein [Thermomonospora cellulosilytica]